MTDGHERPETEAELDTPEPRPRIGIVMRPDDKLLMALKCALIHACPNMTGREIAEAASAVWWTCKRFAGERADAV